MGNQLKILLKKQVTELMAFTKKDKGQIDFLGMLLTLFLLFAFVGIFVTVFLRFSELYSAIKTDRALNVSARQYELLTITYSILFFFNVLSGIKAINFAVFESDDLKILIHMPIKSETIFLSKLITIYLKQIVNGALIILPVNLTFAYAAGQGFYYVFMSILMCFIFPVATLSVSAVFALPVYYIKRNIQSKYVLLLVIITLSLALGFYFYSVILNFVKNLMISGDIRSFFNETTMDGIIKATSFLYPANMFASILLKRKAGACILYLTCFVVAASIIGYFVVRSMFLRVIQNRISGKGKLLYVKPKKLKSSSITAALIKKEFNDVLRTPDYAFQYFSTALIMPLMVYFCMAIGSSMLESLIMVECNFELSIFVIVLFSVLTNTFCATNISREGYAFYALKTMPFTHRQLVFSKIIFCSIVSGLSIFISAVMLLIIGYIGFLQMLFTLAAALLISFAQICLATRMDFNRPRFSTDADNEIKESNNTISAVIIIGLITAFAIGASMMFFTVKYQLLESEGLGEFIAVIIAGTISLLSAAGALAYLLTGLDKKYYELSEGM